MSKRSLPSFRDAGRKVMSRLLSGDDTRTRLTQALGREAERVALARSRVERAQQLARVLDAVAALAELDGIRDPELQALRARRLTRTQAVLGVKQQLSSRTSGAVAQAWQRAGDLRGSRLGASAPLRIGPPVRVGRVGRSVVGSRTATRLVAASLLHLPRLQRQLATLTRGANLALSTVRLAQVPRSTVSARSSLSRVEMELAARLPELAVAGAQHWLRHHLLPGLLRSVLPDVHRRLQ